MKTLLAFVILLGAASCLYAVTVDGYCYLEGTTHSDSTKVKFVKVSPSAQTDSTYTNATGGFNANLVPGIYDIEYSRTNYFTYTLNSQSLVQNTTLASASLELSTGLVGNLSGVLGPGYFRVADSISVQLGDSLRIMPGTTFRFDGQYAFNVKGILKAEGTAVDSIFFITDVTYGPERWAGLRFLVGGSSPSRISYCRISKGIGPKGGGVRCVGTSPNFSNCEISNNVNNSQVGWGGGVYYENGSPTFRDCVFKNNAACSGGGVGQNIANSTATFVRCTFSENTSEIGGGAYNFYSSFDHCIFLNNRSGGSAAGYFSNCSLTDCEVIGNTATASGGAGGLSAHSSTLSNCIISGNRATGSGGTGGGINASSCTLLNCDISGNAASGQDNQGGGVYAYESNIVGCLILNNTAYKGGGIYCAESTAITSCTVTNNSAIVGGGVYVVNCASTISNNIVSFSVGPGIQFQNSVNCHVQYCDVFGNTGGDISNSAQGPAFIGELLATNHNGDSADIYLNIFKDPMFVDTAASDYHLLLGSSCIDAGDPSLPNDPDSTFADIGAFPYLGPRPQLSLLSPNGGEQWRIFQNDTVRWSRIGVTAPIRIELNRHYPFNVWEVLAASTVNDGEEVFYMNDPLSDSCRIRITAIGTLFRDSSDADFRITSSQGYLALVQVTQPSVPILSWSTGAIECPQTATISCKLKNFGAESIVVFQPLEPPTLEFSRSTNCASFFALAPNQMSTCSLRVSYSPQNEATHHDTIRIQTDAVNAVGGYVRIPLVGSQTRTPATPQVVITIQGEDAHLNWNPVTQSVGGCAITVTRYLVFFSEEYTGPFWYHGYTSDTSYTQYGAVTYAQNMYYSVRAVAAPASFFASLPPPDSPRQLTEEQVVEMLRAIGAEE